MQICSARLDESVGGQQLSSHGAKYFRLDSSLAPAAAIPEHKPFYPKPSFYPFCCVICVIVLMGNQSSL